MKNAFFLFYEHSAREYEYCLTIKNRIEHTDNNISVFVFSYHFEKYKALDLLKEYNVIGILVPFAYTKSDLKYYDIFQQKNHDTILFNPHHEEITTPNCRYLVLPKDRESQNCVVHLVWTEWFKNEIVKVGVNENLVYVTGNGRNDLAKSATLTREELALRFNLDARKKWILYAENRKIDQMHDVHSESYEITKKAYDETMRQFKLLDDSFFEKYELIYRLHPGSNDSSVDNIKIHCIKDLSIYEWINNVDLIISYSSTVAFEADMNNVPVVIHNPTNTPPEYMQEGLDFYKRLDDINSISNELINYLKQEIKLSNNFEKYMGKCNGTNIDDIVSIMMNLVQHRPSNLENLNLNVPHSYYLKKRVRGNLFRLYKRSGLLNLVRAPKLIYNNQEDVPF